MTDKITDPFAAREAEKYERPVPSRELILQYIIKASKPLTREEITEGLQQVDEDSIEGMRRRLRAMERDGQLLRNRNRRYCLINKTDLVAGRVIGHPDGFGFLTPDEGKEDIFLAPKEMYTVFHNDRVVVRINGIDRRGRKEGTIVELLERNTHEVVGRMHTDNGVSYVIPDNRKIAQDIFIPEANLAGAKEDQLVIAEIISQPQRRKQAIGRIAEVLGDHMAAGMEVEVAIRTYELPHKWPEALTQSLKSIGDEVPEQAKEGRTDLRNTPLVTIDGEDARDFDDAVYCKRTPKGWRLLVAIADVSHYVQPDSELDIEAHKRSTSVYFPDQVLPMLPEVLSNGLCSLNPDVDRLCMVCELNIDDKGQVYRSRFFDAVMRSHARLTYTEVAKILQENDPGLKEKYSALVPHLEELYKLYKVLRIMRETRGTMDFETQESRIVFGENRKIEAIEPVQRNDAHKLIEECMITANMAAAKFLTRKKIPRLLRIHTGPTPEKVTKLRTFLNELGLSLEGGDQPVPADYMRLTQQIQGRPDAHLIQTVLLRSMTQAVYSPEDKPHFGLALEAYTHFTSPIRRYPDLLIHRGIRHCLLNKKPDTFRYSLNDMLLLGEHCSNNERRADEATRDVTSWLKCEYMMDKIGESFPGIISAVTSFGIFVELKDVFVEGLVHISTMGQDFFHFDPIGHRLNGERTGINYRLGDSVMITVAQVNLDEKKIDFDLIQEAVEATSEPIKKKRKRRRSKISKNTQVQK